MQPACGVRILKEVAMKKIRFSKSISAPRARVWETMIGPETYKQWTAAFCEGSYYEGSWEQGRPIRFLAPGGGGMIAEIAENRYLEFISIRHLGQIENGVEDTTSDKVKSWAPAYENYSFFEAGGGTRLEVEMDTLEDWEQYMLDAWPKALEKLAALCEPA
jgi:uncharacterized protein YndB with AHSA1/START domain